MDEVEAIRGNAEKRRKKPEPLSTKCEGEDLGERGLSTKCEGKKGLGQALDAKIVFRFTGGGLEGNRRVVGGWVARVV